MKRRLLSVVTAVTLLIGTLPMGLSPVSAASTTAVEYTRLEPEVAILNAFTAADSNFYEKLKGACRGEEGASQTPYPAYNGMSELFWMQSGMWSAHPSFMEDTGMTSSFTWSPLERDGYATPTFEKSTLKRLMQTFDNLAVKVSGEFQNYTHKHTFWKGVIPYEREVTNFLTATLDISGNQSIPVSGLDGIGLDNYRDGDDNSYLPIFYHEGNNDVSLNFTKAKIDYYNGKYCTCNGANANHMLITFRDKRAPQLTSVSYSNNGTSWRDRYSSSGNWQLGAGNDLYIKLSFDEPIRFSDDDAKGKNSLKIGLKLAGKSVRDDMYANLYKLDTDTLYFKYTVPDDMDLDEDIVSLDLSSLFGNGLKLVQMQRVYNDGHFTIENDVLKELGITDTYGFNTTDCYVTDIAGNALVRGDISNPRLHIDTNAPEIETIDFGAVYNNDDVNKALNDTELNLSGKYLGEGDSINMKLVMSEPLNLTLPKTEQGYYRMDWKYAKVKTNIYKKDGTQVVVKSRWFTPSTPNKYLNTKTTFVMESIPIEEGMYVDTTDNPDGEVRVESVDMSEYGEPITDMKGNAISVSNVKIKLGAGSNPPKLDTTPPTVKAGDYIPVDDGFRQQVNIADAETGVSDIYGEFVLTQAGDSNDYTYQYAVSADPDATNLDWKQGKTGVAQEFKQKETTWIHIKPDDSTQYDNLDKCTMVVYAKDLAGNTGMLTMGSDQILWYVDNRAPKATAGETRKVISGDAGTLEADISFDDSHQISAWEYAWSSDNTSLPTAWETGGGISEGYTGTSITVTASKEVASGSKFEGYLWVRATDDSTKKNQSEAECIGKYAYDLTAAKYALSYSASVTEKASLKVSQLDVNDALVFMIPVPNTTNQYSVLRVTADNFVADKNIFAMDSWENWYVSENGGIYTMTAKSDHSISNIIDGTYAGNLEVQVLSGKTAGLVGVGGSQWSAGGDGYTFSISEKINLRLASNNPWKNYSILVSEPNPEDYIRLTTTASTGLGNTKQIWDGTNTLNSTLAGCEFDITIDQDRFGWNGDDIDCRKSKLVVTNTTEGKTNEVPLTAFSKNSDGKWSQKIIVSGDYTSGVYTAVLKLESVTGSVAEIPITGSARTIVVDATEPNENLTLSSILNNRYSLGSYTAYGVEDFYPERECIKEGESVIELPIGAGYFDRSRNQSWASSSELYKLTFTSENEPNRQSLTDKSGNLYSYIGQYYVEVWTEDKPDKKVKFNTESAEQTNITNRNYRVIDGEGWDANGFSILDKDKDDPNFVYLTPDTENKVYFRKVYANGRTTQTQSVFIKPVNEQLKGTMSLDKENKKLVFTPTTGDETSIGATVYAFAYQNGQDYTKGEGERIAMDYYGGVWTCDLKDNGAIYRVVTINSHGSIWASEEDDEIRQLAPYLAAEPTYTDNGDGTYRLEVSLYDDYDTIKKEGLMLSVGFNSDYATEPYTLEVTKNLFDEYSPNTYTETIKGYSKNGIYQAEVSVSPGWQNAYDYLKLTVDGVMMKKNSDSIEEQPMQITVTAVDAYGNRMETSTDSKTVRYHTPKIIAHELTQDGLKLTFNHPVVPTDSWAWQENQQKEVICQREWAGAFPVAANGTYEIEFRDVFGNICKDELITEDFTKDGIDWSLNLTFSETELTKDAILFTAEMPNNENKDKKTGVLIYDKPTITTLVPEGNYNGYPHKGNSVASFDPDKPWDPGAKYAPSSPRTVKLEKNTQLEVFVYNSTWVDNYNNNLIFSQPVYINNIANEAPEAKVYYYHPMIGSDMSREQLEQYVAKRGGSLKLEGSMQVTYKTSRSVTPTNDSGSVFFFTPTNYTASHTFSYIDDMGHSGSAEVSLPDGLELAKPAVPYVDTTPPSVKVALSAKTNGSYTEMESFIAGETQEQIKEKVLNMDTAQGYSLKVNAQDESDYTMTVTEADGVSVMGNMILVDKPSAFTVTVTDKSENKNETSFSMTADMFEKMDNIPPTAEIDTQSVSMYEKKLVVQLRDTNNKGEDTTKDEGGNDLDSVTLISPSDAVKVGPNKYEYTVKENGKVDFVFRDRAGNRNAGEGASAMVSGIDTDPPKLKLTWAPPLSYFDDETSQTVIDYSQPTSEMVGTDVTAFVDSDKAMYKLTIAWGGQNPVTLLEKGMPTENNPYVIDNQGEPVVTISATTERISVVYAEGFGQSLDFTAYAANGKSSEIDVQAWVNIDKITPQITAVQENLYRQKDGGGAYSVPYAVKVTFTPDEWVFSDNYGGTEMVDYGNGPTEEYKYFSYDEPLVLTFTENGTYHVRFSDEVGNVTVETVTISGIDRTEPNITLGELSGGGQAASIPVTVDEDCTVSVNGSDLQFTAGVEQTITFSNNGSYTIVATDSAGNKDERVVTVGSIDRIVPSISFTSGTIYVLRNGDVNEYNNQLSSGYTVWDNKTAVENLAVNYDASAVKLDTTGMYTVVYTVTDEAGNENQANRFVQVIGEDTTCICIDGVLVMPDSTAVIKPGTHTLTLKNGNEPYRIKARKGIRTSGQMKYLKSSSLSFDENGEFAVSNEGYYTVQVTTQSRKVIRIKLYVEQ